MTPRITIEPGKRSGQPCVRGLRITVWDVLAWLAGGMTEQQILDDYPELEPDDFRAVYEFAARMGRRDMGVCQGRELRDREHRHRPLRTRHNNRATSQGRVAPALGASDEGRGAGIAARGHPDHGIRRGSGTRSPRS